MMNQQPTSAEDRDAIKRCFDAYGADIAKWSADKRERFGAIASSDEMAPLRREAEALDNFLGAATAPHASAALKNIIAEQYEKPTEKISLSNLISGLNLEHRWLSAGAFASIGALGIVSGVMTANAQSALTPEAEAYAYAEDIFSMVMLDEEEDIPWDGD